VPLLAQYPYKHCPRGPHQANSQTHNNHGCTHGNHLPKLHPKAHGARFTSRYLPSSDPSGSSPLRQRGASPLRQRNSDLMQTTVGWNTGGSLWICLESSSRNASRPSQDKSALPAVQRASNFPETPGNKNIKGFQTGQGCKLFRPRNSNLQIHIIDNRRRLLITIT